MSGPAYQIGFSDIRALTPVFVFCPLMRPRRQAGQKNELSPCERNRNGRVLHAGPVLHEAQKTT